MKTITESEYNKKHSDSKGIFQNLQSHPEMEKYIGKRTMLDWEDGIGTVLLIEDASFKIIPD